MTRRVPAVLVIDAVPPFFTCEGADQLNAVAAANAIHVVSLAREHGTLVIHSQLSFRSDGIDGGHYFAHNPDLAYFSGDAVQSVDGLAALNDELVVLRQYPSPFFATSLAATLRGAEVDSVVIVGAKTSEGVRAAAIDAMQHGFGVAVVSDAVTDPNQARHRMALEEIADRYGKVTSAADISLQTNPTTQF